MGKQLEYVRYSHFIWDYLRTYDSFVSLDPTSNRNFVGIVLEVNGHKYCAPLSSPKTKHRFISDSAIVDVVKIDGGKLDIIKLNNMIPVHESAIIHMDISDVTNEQYKQLLTNQMLFIRSNADTIKKKSRRLYQIVKSQKQPKLNNRCCNFLLLEDAASKFSTASNTVRETAASEE